MDWTSIAMGVLGGVGLFLLGMRLMTDGLRVAAGRALKRILERWTATRMRAVLSGVLITSVVQSSSAVTVAVIGFANAGLLSLGQAVAVIYGSNVGTTVTGWLVALVGFNLDVKAMALPGIGVGMVLRLVGGNRRLGGLGEALAGFGLFFMGIDVLKSSLSLVQDRVPLDSLAPTGGGGVLLLVLVGIALTVIMQSSSAAMAVVLTAVGGGLLPIAAGACAVIGANIGTTSTAAIAVIGATSNAKRVAMAHVAFNTVTGAVALATLPLLLLLLDRFREAFGLGAEPAAVLAGFHTIFNLLGVALMWPLTNRLVDVLEKRFRTREEEEGHARYLDRNVLATPLLAVRALGLELARAGAIAREMAQQSVRGRADAERLERRRVSLGALLVTIGDFVIELQRLRVPEELGSSLPTALRVARYHAEAAELSTLIAKSRETMDPLAPDLQRLVGEFESRVMRLLELSAVDEESASPELAEQGLALVDQEYGPLKDRLLEAGVAGQVGVSTLVAHLDHLSNVHRLAAQMAQASLYLWQLEALVSGDEAEDGAEPSAASDHSPTLTEAA